MLTERELIRFIAARAPGAGRRRGEVGIGDDCAVVRAAGRSILLTTDLLIERVHFDLAYTPPYWLGRKAVAASLSDIAAMGGRPRALFVAVALPATKPARFARELFEGIHHEALAAKASVLGGDTSSTPGPVFVDVTALGEPGPRGPVLRSGARTGHRLYLSGALGASAAGLEMLRAGRRPPGRPPASAHRQPHDPARGAGGPTRSALLAHLWPRPRLALGRVLADRGLASAMIDVSDGLSSDLHNLCEASQIGARLEEARIPIHPAAAGPGGGSGLDRALGGGEDYELLFTVPPRAEAALRRLARRGFSLTRIGEITGRRKGVVLVDPGGRARALDRTGFEHLR